MALDGVNDVDNPTVPLARRDKLFMPLTVLKRREKRLCLLPIVNQECMTLSAREFQFLLQIVHLCINWQNQIFFCSAIPRPN